MDYSTGIGYLAMDVARDIDIPTSTLNKWTIDLEKKAGILIKRSENGHHIYSERELHAFREIKNLLNNRISFEEALTDAATNLIQNESIKPDEIHLSKTELQEIIRKEVHDAIQEERETMFRAIEIKMNEIKEMLKEINR